MKYEITIEERVFQVEVHKGEEGYRYSIDGQEESFCTMEQLNAGRCSFLFQDRSVDVLHCTNDAEVEMHFEGARYVSSVVDPRKKSLQIGTSGSGDVVSSQMPGRVISILVSVGDSVEKGQVVATVEAMKMENPLKAPRAGVIAAIEVSPGDLLEAKAVLLSLE